MSPGALETVLGLGPKKILTESFHRNVLTRFFWNRLLNFFPGGEGSGASPGLIGLIWSLPDRYRFVVEFYIAGIMPRKSSGGDGEIRNRHHAQQVQIGTYFPPPQALPTSCLAAMGRKSAGGDGQIHK